MHVLDAGEVIESLGLACLRDLATFESMPDPVIIDLLERGTISELERNEYIARFDEEAADFQVVLRGMVAYYKRFDGRDVLTRRFAQGEQIGFDEMIGLIARNGTDVASETCVILSISSAQFYELHVNYPAEFGILMINLARELSREIEVLEDVIGDSTGWLPEDGPVS